MRLAESSWKRISRRAPGSQPHLTKRHGSGNHPQSTPLRVLSNPRIAQALLHDVPEHLAARPGHLAQVIAPQEAEARARGRAGRVEARREVQPPPAGEARGDVRGGQEALRCELRDGAGDGLPGVGDSGDGLVTSPPQIGVRPRGAPRSRPLGGHSSAFYGRRAAATPDNRPRSRRRPQAAATRCGSDPRILECRTCVEQTRPQAAPPPGEDSRALPSAVAPRTAGPFCRLTMFN